MWADDTYLYSISQGISDNIFLKWSLDGSLLHNSSLSRRDLLNQSYNLRGLIGHDSFLYTCGTYRISCDSVEYIFTHCSYWPGGDTNYGNPDSIILRIPKNFTSNTIPGYSICIVLSIIGLSMVILTLIFCIKLKFSSYENVIFVNHLLHIGS